MVRAATHTFANALPAPGTPSVPVNRGQNRRVRRTEGAERGSAFAGANSTERDRG